MMRSWKMQRTAMTRKLNRAPMTAMKMKKKRKVTSAVLESQSYSQERKNPLIRGCNCFVISETFEHDWYLLCCFL